MKTIAVIFLLLAPVIWMTAQQNSVPDVLLKDLDGKNVNSSEITRPGAPTLVVFWNAGNGKCCDNLSNLEEAWDEVLRGLGIRMVVVSNNCNGNWNAIKPIVNGNAWDFETYIDVNGDLGRAMGVCDGPCTMLFNENEELVCRSNSVCTGGTQFICENFFKHLNNSLTAKDFQVKK